MKLKKAKKVIINVETKGREFFAKVFFQVEKSIQKLLPIKRVQMLCFAPGFDVQWCSPVKHNYYEKKKIEKQKILRVLF